MKFIPIMEISGQIMTLIEDAEKSLIIVSPYIEIAKWEKLKKCLQRAVDRGVSIIIYTREYAKQNLDPLRAFKVKIILVKDLHAKIYLNDAYGIVSSQNLYHYSDINSIDFAYKTETDEERNQLVNLINKYLANSKPIEQYIIASKTEVGNEIVVEKEEGTNVFPLKDIDLEKIKEWFHDKFPEIKMNSTKQYVYCNKLLACGDVMLREGFEIRFSYGIKNQDQYIKAIQTLNFENNNYKYEKTLVTNNPQAPYLIYVPQEVTDIQKLIYDYIFIAKTIIDKTRNIKI